MQHLLIRTCASWLLPLMCFVSSPWASSDIATYDRHEAIQVTIVNCGPDQLLLRVELGDNQAQIGSSSTQQAWTNVGASPATVLTKKTTEELRPGDELTTECGDHLVISSVDGVSRGVRVYNIAVGGTNTFFANGILVHNKGPDPGEQ